MTFTLEHLEFYLLILMRVSGFIMTAPFFSYSSVPMRIRAAMSVFMSLVVIQVTTVGGTVDGYGNGIIHGKYV